MRGPRLQTLGLAGLLSLLTAAAAAAQPAAPPKAQPVAAPAAPAAAQPGAAPAAPGAPAAAQPAAAPAVPAAAPGAPTPAPPAAPAAPTAPGADAEGFVPVRTADQPEEEERLSSPRLVATAYSAIWLAVLVYLLSLWVRSRRLADDLDGLERRLETHLNREEPR